MTFSQRRNNCGGPARPCEANINKERDTAHPYRVGVEVVNLAEESLEVRREQVNDAFQAAYAGNRIVLGRCGLQPADADDVIQVAWLAAYRWPPKVVTGVVLFRIGRTMRGRPASPLAAAFYTWLRSHYRNRERRIEFERLAAMLVGGRS